MTTTNKNDSSNVSYGKPKKVGAVYYAPVGTTLPAKVTDDLDAAFKCVGYISEDGIKNSDKISSDHVSAWGGDAVLYTQGEHEDTFELTMIEATNADTLKSVYGRENVSVDTDGTITVRSNSADRPEYTWVYDFLLKNGGAKRIVVPDAKITDMGEITYNDSDPIGYDCTFSALPYSGYGGDTHREYIVKGTTTATTASSNS